MDMHHDDDPTPDPRLGGEPAHTVDRADEGWNEDTEDPGDDVGTI
jgi:hypothetical protein